MKTTLKKVALICATIGFFNAAQAQKIAHVNVDSLVRTMPETKTASEAAKKYSDGLQQELLAMQTELDNKQKDYMEKEAGMSELLKKTKQEDFQQLYNRIESFRNQASEDYQRKSAELTKPIMEKAKKAIEAVAKEGGYKYVLDASPQGTSILFSEPSDDILALVKKKLDSMPMAVIPGVAPAGTGGIKPSPPATTTSTK
jgi:outer membrane protein